MWTVSRISFIDGRPFPFSREWLGLYLVWGVWFPSHLPLDKTNCVHNFGLYLVTLGTRGILP
jgi:hypothetical protein